MAIKLHKTTLTYLGARDGGVLPESRGPGLGAILPLRNRVIVGVLKMYFNLFVSFKDSVNPNTKTVYTHAHAQAHTPQLKSNRKV